MMPPVGVGCVEHHRDRLAAERSGHELPIVSIETCEPLIGWELREAVAFNQRDLDQPASSLIVEVIIQMPQELVPDTWLACEGRVRAILIEDEESVVEGYNTLPAVRGKRVD